MEKKEKKSNKKIKIISISILTIFGLVFMYIYSFKRPTFINRIIAEQFYDYVAIDSGFEDQEFYNCVIASFGEIPYTEPLTEDDLNQITAVSCDNKDKDEDKKIANTKGIEKLVNLETFSCTDCNIDSIDLSNNTKLTSLSLKNNKLGSNQDVTPINLIYNKELLSLDLSGNKDLEMVDVTYNYKLNTLNLDDTKLDSLDLTHNSELTSLTVNSDYFKALDNGNVTIDLSKNTKLTTVTIKNKTKTDGNSGITNISLDKNTELTNLSLSGNSIKEIDLSENTKLTNLNVSYNSLTELDLSECVEIDNLVVSGNNFKTSQVMFKDSSKNELNSPIIFSDTYTIGTAQIDKMEWESSDSNIIKYDGDKLVSNKSGIVTLTGSLENGQGISFISNVNFLNSALVNDGERLLEYSINITMMDAYSDEYVMANVNDENYYIVYFNEFDKDKLKCDYCSLKYDKDEENNENKVDVYYNGEKVRTYELIKLETDYSTSKEAIYVGDDTTPETIEGKILMDQIEGISIVYNLDGDNKNIQIKKGENIIAEYKLSSDSALKTFIDSLDNENVSVDTDGENKIIKGIESNTKTNVLTSNLFEYKFISNNIGDSNLIKTGDKFVIYYGNNKTDEYILSVKGDVLGTGLISKNNAKEIAENILGSNTFTDEWVLDAADYNNDSNIDLKDVIDILKKLKSTETVE